MLSMHGFLVPNKIIRSAEPFSFPALRAADVITTMRLVMPLDVFAVKLSILAASVWVGNDLLQLRLLPQKCITTFAVKLQL